MRGMNRSCVAVGAAMCAWLAAAGACFGFALAGPNDAEDGFGGAADPEVLLFQPFDAGFRWQTANLQYSIDQSFIAAFGQAGADAVRSAFATWSGPVGRNGPANTSVMFDPGPDVNDIETVALHEIGHALGLHHPNHAGNQNFDTQGNVRQASGKEVMASSLAKNEARRALTQDDLDGFNQLYDSNTIFKTLNADATALLDTTGPGGVNFTEVPGLAASGPQDGANVDIFAADLGMGQIGNVPLAVTRVWSGSRTPGGTSVDFMDGNGPTDLGGYLQGEVSDLSNHPDFPMHLPYAGETIHSIDIIFNTNQVSMLGVNPLPEPGSALLLLAGCTAMIVRRQCRPPCRADRASRR